MHRIGKGCLWKTSAVLLVIALLFSACGKDGVATTMNLKKTEGTVGVSDDAGKDVELVEDMKLYSGYDMSTEPASYAWIDLDNVKLAKMDEETEVGIQKEKKKLELLVHSGSVYFHVSEPLEKDETMDIHTSSMTVGIRGTCGWVNAENQNHSRVYILEGTVAVTAGGDGETTKVRAGEAAEVVVDENGNAEITVSKFREKDIPEFVLTDLVQDEVLTEEILQASGLDVLNAGGASDEAYEAVMEEYREFLADIRSTFPGGQPDYSDWVQNYLDTYLERYPLIGSYMDFVNGNDVFQYARFDIDGNGTEELIVGYLEETSGTRVTGIYSFDGEEAVMQEGMYYELLGDGLLLETGNGYVSGRVYRLGSDGYTWEEVTDSGIESGVPVDELDLSAHGGFLRDTLEWTPLD